MLCILTSDLFVPVARQKISMRFVLVNELAAFLLQTNHRRVCLQYDPRGFSLHQSVIVVFGYVQTQ